jgi:hypothetical protein
MKKLMIFGGPFATTTTTTTLILGNYSVKKKIFWATTNCKEFFFNTTIWKIN